VREIPHPGVRAHARLGEDAVGGGATDAEDEGEADLDPLFTRQIHASNSRHRLPLPLLVLRVALADDAERPLPPHDLAMLTNRLDTRANLHEPLPGTGFQWSTRMYRGS